MGAVIQCWRQQDDEEKHLLNMMTTVQFFSVAPEHYLKYSWVVPVVSVGIQCYCCPERCVLRLKRALPHKLALTNLLQEMDSVLV